jgi:electron transfer flavoprotein alpha/beta subunit
MIGTAADNLWLCCLPTRGGLDSGAISHCLAEIINQNSRQLVFFGKTQNR